MQGKIHDEEDGGLYGVCLPATGFSALFVLFSLLTVVSILVSGFVCYHRTLAKVSEENPPEPNGAGPATNAALFRFFTLKLLEIFLNLKSFLSWYSALQGPQISTQKLIGLAVLKTGYIKN